MLGLSRFLILRRVGIAVSSLLALPAFAAAPARAPSGWSIQPAPTPPGGGSLHGVSCVSRTVCFAVGIGSTDQALTTTLAERWNGHAWKIQHTPSPPGGGNLNAVSCTAANACMAVGQTGSSPLAERWGGTRWKILRTPNPSEGGELTAVSCTAANACTAVGGSQPAGAVGSVMHWNGNKWTLQAQYGGDGPALFGVSCTDGMSCAAVGERLSLVRICHPLIGCKWGIESYTVAGHLPRLKVSGTFGELDGVFCTSKTNCLAVGTSGGDLPLAERLINGSWAVESAQDPPSAWGALTGASCTSAAACTAVGAATSWEWPHPPSTLAEGLTGSTWTIQPTPDPTGATSTSLAAVSCPTSEVCTAVGNYVDSSGTYTLVERHSN